MAVLIVILGVLMILGGISCISTPLATFTYIVALGGVLILFDAIADICAWSYRRRMGTADGWSLAGAIISLVIGLLLICNDVFRFAADFVIAYAIGVWLIALGAIRVVRALRYKQFNDIMTLRFGGFSIPWGWTLAFGILMVIAGIVALCFPLVTLMTLGAIVGVSVIVAGVNLIIGTFALV